MSSRRSRSGGTWISMVFRRKSRSCRKRPAATSALQVGVGGGEDPHVDLLGAEEPTRSNSPVSSTRRSLACRLERDVGDLIEEERAAVGQFEAADAVAFARR